MNSEYITQDIISSKISLVQKKAIVQLYIQVFSEPPRSEKIDSITMMKELFSHNSLFTLLIQKNNQTLIGFIASYSVDDFSDKHLLSLEVKKAGYISEFALSGSVRGKGLGRQLLNHHLQKISELYDVVYSRSRRDVKNIVHLFTTVGFSIEFDYMVTTNGVRSHKNIYKKVFS